MEALALLLLAILPRDTVLVDHFDALEINSHYSESWIEDEQGVTYERKLIFVQVLCLNWYGEHSAHHVDAWRMRKGPELTPRYDHARKVWTVTFMDGDNLRRIDAKSYRETHTLFDPELTDREEWPKEKRRELRTPFERKK